MSYSEPRCRERCGFATEQFEPAWKIFLECGEYERHLNNIQSVYRGLASTWILAMFSAVGLVIGSEFNVSLQPFVVFVIGFVAAIGVLVLWRLDVLAYHRLLLAVFAEGLRLERTFPWLPRVRLNMKRTEMGDSDEVEAKTNGARDALRTIVSQFYLWLAILPILVSLAGILWAEFGLGGSKIAVLLSKYRELHLIMWFLFAGSGVFAYRIWKRSKEISIPNDEPASFDRLKEVRCPLADNCLYHRFSIPR